MPVDRSDATMGDTRRGWRETHEHAGSRLGMEHSAELSSEVGTTIVLGGKSVMVKDTALKAFDRSHPLRAFVMQGQCVSGSAVTRCAVKLMEASDGKPEVMKREQQALMNWTSLRENLHKPLEQVPILEAYGSVDVAGLGPCYALVMCPVGKSLSDLMGAQKTGLVQMVEESCDKTSLFFLLAEDMLRALEAAALLDEPTVHRDISPGNIVAVNGDGSPCFALLREIQHFVLIDWGMSMEVEESLLEFGWAGTVPFMPTKMLEALGRKKQNQFCLRYNGEGALGDLESLLLTLAYFAVGEAGLFLNTVDEVDELVGTVPALLRGREMWANKERRTEWLTSMCPRHDKIATFLGEYQDCLQRSKHDISELPEASVVVGRAKELIESLLRLVREHRKQAVP